MCSRGPFSPRRSCFPGWIGVYGGSDRFSPYEGEELSQLQQVIHREKDFLTTRVAYKLGLVAARLGRRPVLAAGRSAAEPRRRRRPLPASPAHEGDSAIAALGRDAPADQADDDREDAGGEDDVEGQCCGHVDLPGVVAQPWS